MYNIHCWLDNTYMQNYVQLLSTIHIDTYNKTSSQNKTVIVDQPVRCSELSILER